MKKTHIYKERERAYTQDQDNRRFVSTVNHLSFLFRRVWQGRLPPVWDAALGDERPRPRGGRLQPAAHLLPALRQDLHAVEPL